MSTVITVEGLNYFYRTDWTRQRRHALRDLSFSVEQGEVFGFLGHNGAGKTTTIKCLLDLVKPSSGTISVFGIDAKNPSCRNNIGYVPEQPYFYDHLSVQETMELYASLKGLHAAARATEINKALTTLGIADRSKSRMRALSKGLMQRVAMAQAILGAPKLLILDEPFSGLDPLGRKEFRDLLVAQKNAGTTILVSSHILSDMELLCSRASIMVRGELKGIYNLAQLPTEGRGSTEIAYSVSGLEKPSLSEAVLSLATEQCRNGELHKLKFSSDDAAQRALAELVRAGARVHSFETLHGNLEDIFVNLVKGEQK